ncbi:thiamine pyrophosphate-binding protein, partial [Klebsiella pneumoniae]|uniref:thiamine pyrophosphate-binding protein n=1 Tax=Klebsiella pneumoniae TaxID=573 RepID=UPI003EE10143
MRGTAGKIVYETLKAYGVTCLFGMEDPIHIFHAVDRAFTRIVTVRDEKHAAIMAHGYAQATGRP